ncbi:MAG TPA: XdhC family protein [Pirellulales bacterium]|nr:XdhC family protein [Pirellulales bacterium]
MIRNDLKEMISLAERLEAAAEPAILATLFAANGSTYRPLGSMMIGGPSSAFLAGGVSGGCLEEFIARRGRALARQKSAIMLSFAADPDADHSDAPSLGCGGSIDVLIERFTADHLAFLRRFAAAYDADQASTAICTIDTSANSEIAVQRSLWTDGDEMSGNEATNLDPQIKLLRERALLAKRSMQGTIGPHRRALVHYVRPIVRLVVLGAGNDARPICSLGHSLGWHVCVADRRARMATHGRFPDADQVVASDWWTALRSITFTPQTAIVLMTHSLVDDAEILPLLAERPAAYVGVLGPAHRRRWLLEHVEGATTLPEKFVNRLRGPIGLDLGDRSPGGIAVAMVAEILAELNGRTPVPLCQPTDAKLSQKHVLQGGREFQGHRSDTRTVAHAHSGQQVCDLAAGTRSVPTT